MSKEKKKVLAQYYALRIKRGILTRENILNKYPEIENELDIALVEVL